MDLFGQLMRALPNGQLFRAPPVGHDWAAHASTSQWAALVKHIPDVLTIKVSTSLAALVSTSTMFQPTLRLTTCNNIQHHIRPSSRQFCVMVIPLSGFGWLLHTTTSNFHDFVGIIGVQRLDVARFWLGMGTTGDNNWYVDLGKISWIES